ncbi:MAG: SDR family NAD(P)-dependent oxidoreductase [Clostridium sp.]
MIVNYNGSKEKAEETVKEIGENGGQAEAIQCSVADFSQSRELIDTIVKKYGRLDISSQ